MALTDIAAHGGDSVAGVVTVTSMGRSAADVADELLGVLADEPRVVECDLTDMTAEGTAVAEEFAAVGHYLSHWPGTVVMVTAPDPVVRARLDSAEFAEFLLIHAGGDAGVVEAHRLLPSLERVGLELPPRPTAPQEARSFVANTLQDWQLSGLIDPASHVVSAFVTNAVVYCPSTLNLSLSRVDDRIRIAVRDHDGSTARAAGSARQSGSGFDGRGRQLVHAFVDGWDTIPARSGGKTMWAVLSGDSSERADGSVRHSRGRHRDETDTDALAELPNRHSARHRLDDSSGSRPQGRRR